MSRATSPTPSGEECLRNRSPIAGRYCSCGKEESLSLRLCIMHISTSLATCTESLQKWLSHKGQLGLDCCGVCKAGIVYLEANTPLVNASEVCDRTFHIFKGSSCDRITRDGYLVFARSARIFDEQFTLRHDAECKMLRQATEIFVEQEQQCEQ